MTFIVICNVSRLAKEDEQHQSQSLRQSVLGLMSCLNLHQGTRDNFIKIWRLCWTRVDCCVHVAFRINNSTSDLQRLLYQEDAGFPCWYLSKIHLPWDRPQCCSCLIVPLSLLLFTVDGRHLKPGKRNLSFLSPGCRLKKTNKPNQLKKKRSFVAVL